MLDSGAWRELNADAEAIGIYKRTRPQIEELPLRPGLTVVAFSDGVWTAGRRHGGQLDVLDLLHRFPQTLGARAYADELLAHALQQEQGRPSDDLTVVALHVASVETDNVRRMQMSLPVPARVYQSWRES